MTQNQTQTSAATKKISNLPHHDSPNRHGTRHNSANH